MKTKWAYLVIFVLLIALAISYYCDPPPDSRIDKCRTWSLGEDWRELERNQIPERWNDRHGDLFLLKDTSSVTKSRLLMLKAWMRRPDASYSDVKDMSFKELYGEN